MTSLSRSETIKTKPVGNGLNAFHEAFHSTCENLKLSSSSDAIHRIDTEGDSNYSVAEPFLTKTALKTLVLDLLLALQNLPVSRLLPSGRGTLRSDLLRLSSLVDPDDFDIQRVIPLLSAVVNHESDQAIWNKAYAAVTESTPPPRPLPCLKQTPWSRATSSIVDSSENRKDVDDILKDELGSSLYIGVPGFYEAFFGGVQELDSISKAIFAKCQDGHDPVYNEEGGWRNWPKGAKEKDVLEWLVEHIDIFLNFAKEHRSPSDIPRRLLAQPNQPLHGSVAERKLDVGFVDNPLANEDSRCHWSQVLVLGELKSNPGCDTLSKTWRDLARYAREVFFAQDARRFVLGFTLCGSVMRLWEFDRLGGIASSPFDINQNGLKFVSAVLGYLWMDKERLGFDTTILEVDRERYIEIVRDGHRERIILDELMNRSPCVAGRATTCWKAHRAGDQSNVPLVIKDSWQYPEREEEGELLKEATEKGVVNVARYYYHETVSVAGEDDDVRDNMRKGLDISKATNYFLQSKKENSMLPPNPPGMVDSTRIDSISRKRSSSMMNAALPPKKRARSSSLTKKERTPSAQNRIHRRVIVRDYGKPIYKASSRAAMLAALGGCIEGYESLHARAEMLQRDVSIGNLMMNEEEDDPSWRSFLIDLDLAIKEQREEPSGARAKTGTRAFMAIGVLLGEKHSFMHDLESFFWVLFWICIHRNGPDKKGLVTNFDCWNYEHTEKLAVLKKGMIVDEEDFRRTIDKNFTEYYKPLGSWVNRLRKVVFPNGGRWKKEDRALYAWMKDILGEAQKDPDVFAE